MLIIVHILSSLILTVLGIAGIYYISKMRKQRGNSLGNPARSRQGQTDLSGSKASAFFPPLEWRHLSIISLFGKASYSEVK